MLNRRYTYRFKTRKEFRDEYGQPWRNVPMTFVHEMDHLLGVTIDKTMKDSNGVLMYGRIDIMFTGKIIDNVGYYDGFHRFSISKEMLVKEQTTPMYKPKTFIK